jgi:hypothetical protein
MRYETKLNQDFIVRESPKEIIEAIQRICGYEDDDDFRLPNRMITFKETDGDDGLWWDSYEHFWVEYACCPEELSPARLMEELSRWIDSNRKQPALTR